AVWHRTLDSGEIGTLWNSGTGTVASTVSDTDLQIYTPMDLTPFTLEQTGGTLAPGGSQGEMEIYGFYNMGGSAALEIEIGGTTAITDHDVLTVTETATLNGTVYVSLIDPAGGANIFEPELDDFFDVLTATSITGSYTFDYEDADLSEPWMSWDDTIETGGNGQILRLTVVPEPSELVMLAGVAVFGLIGYLRRRRKEKK
ncbi:unnamed protein product, partial [marine sediment metagenome]